jgi:hypothetical protein
MFGGITTQDYFNFLLAKSISWAHYALEEDDFLDFAIPYFQSTKAVNAKNAANFSTHMGVDQLSIVLCNLRKFKDLLQNILPDLITCSAKDLVGFQQKAYGILSRHHHKGTLTGIGPWLYLAPFKIHLCLQRNLWADPAIDSIFLPTGIQVIRGVKELIRNYPGVIQTASSQDLVEDEGGLDEGYARDCLIHNESKNIAVQTNSRVVHVNTGLWKLGKGEITIP